MVIDRTLEQLRSYRLLRLREQTDPAIYSIDSWQPEIIEYIPPQFSTFEYEFGNFIEDSFVTKQLAKILFMITEKVDTPFGPRIKASADLSKEKKSITQLTESAARFAKIVLNVETLWKRDASVPGTLELYFKDGSDAPPVSKSALTWYGGGQTFSPSVPQLSDAEGTWSFIG